MMFFYLCSLFGACTKDNDNKNLDDFPVMKRFDSMDFKLKWKMLDKDEALRDEYWKENDYFEV